MDKRKMIRPALAVTTALCWACAAQEVMAGSVTGPTLGVNATVINACTINTVNALAFGNYDPTSATATSGSTTLLVTCTNGDSISIDLGVGSHSAGGGTTAPLRQMSDGNSHLLAYTLYQPVGTGGSSTISTSTWGAGSGNNFAYTADGTSQTIDVFGSIAALQTVPASNAYADTVSVTVNY